jgi:hypothetical protein
MRERFSSLGLTLNVTSSVTVEMIFGGIDLDPAEVVGMLEK